MSAGLSCQAVLSMIMIFHSLYWGSAWLARTSLMASSALLRSIPNRFCSASRRGRIWPVGNWRLACCPQRTWAADRDAVPVELAFQQQSTAALAHDLQIYGPRRSIGKSTMKSCKQSATGSLPSRSHAAAKRAGS